MKIATAEKITKMSPSSAKSRLRKWEKKMASKARRRNFQRYLDDAPIKVYKGWAD
jgi:hypothetical protein